MIILSSSTVFNTFALSIQDIASFAKSKVKRLSDVEIQLMLKNHLKQMRLLDDTNKWADLYSVWNMAFVSHYKHFPYVLAKLIIPQVADNYGNSDEYIYNRAIALYIHLNYTLLGRLDGEKYPANSMDWYSEKLYLLFGKENLKSSKHYENSLK